MAHKLTPRQVEVLACLVQVLNERGIPPTRAELAATLGFRSPNAAETHLRALARKGVIELAPGTSRGIRLCMPAAMDALESAPSSTRLPAAIRAAGVASGQAGRVAGHAGGHTGGHTGGYTGGQADRDDIRRGTGPSELPVTTPASSAADSTAFLSSMLTLPVIGAVAAGVPILAAPHVEARYQVASDLFRGGVDYLLRVRGMSMRDAGILDGDLLAVRATQDVTNGQIVVARLDDEVTVKRFRRRGQKVTLLPENPDFDPLEIDLDMQALHIEGLAVGVVRTAL